MFARPYARAPSYHRLTATEPIHLLRSPIHHGDGTGSLRLCPKLVHSHLWPSWSQATHKPVPQCSALGVAVRCLRRRGAPVAGATAATSRPNRGRTPVMTSTHLDFAAVRRGAMWCTGKRQKKAAHTTNTRPQQLYFYRSIALQGTVNWIDTDLVSCIWNQSKFEGGLLTSWTKFQPTSPITDLRRQRPPGNRRL